MDKIRYQESKYRRRRRRRRRRLGNTGAGEAANGLFASFTNIYY